MKKIFSVLIILSVFCSFSRFSFAASNDEWIGASIGGASWSDSTNWNVISGSAPPGSGDTATFDTAAGNGSAGIDLGGGVTVDSIVFNTSSAAAYTIGTGAPGSETLTLNDGGSIAVNSSVMADQLFNARLILGTDASNQTDTLTNNSTTNALTFAGPIAGSTSSGSYTDTLQVTGQGNTTISGVIQNGSSSTVALKENGTGSTLFLTGNNTYNGGTTITAGTLQVGDGGSTGSLGSGNVSDNASLVFDLSGTNSFANQISGSGTVTQNSTGTLILTGNNSYNGGTIINAGTLEATTSAHALGTGLVTLSGGTLDLFNDSPLAYGNNVILSTDSTINSDTVDAGAGVTHTLGNLSIGANTLTVGLGNNADSAVQGLSFSSVTLTGNATIDANTGTGGAGGLLTLGAVGGANENLTIGGDANTTITGVIGTTGGSVTQAGTGTLKLSGTNTYTGGTTIDSGGTVVTLNNQALGTSASVLTLNGGTLDLQTNNTAYNTVVAANSTIDSDLATTGAQTNPQTLGTLSIGAQTLTVAPGGNVSGTATLDFGATTLSASGATFTTLTNAVLNLTTISLASGSGFSFTVNGAGDTNITDDINTGTGSLTQSGTGTLTLTGTNTYGATFISNGTLQVGNGGSTGSLGTGAVSLTGNLVFDLSSNVNISNSISGAGDLTQSGSGVLTLSGNNSGFNGTIIINNGDTLEATGTSNALGSSSSLVTLSGGTLDIFNDTALTFANTIDVTADSTINSDTVDNVSGVTHTLGTLDIGTNTLTVNLANNADAGTQGLTINSVDLTGNATIDANTGSGGANTLLTLDAVSGTNENLTIGGTSNVDISNITTGSGSLTQEGSGILTLAGTNTYTGQTILDSGIVDLNSSGAIGSLSEIVFNGGTLQFSSNNTHDYSNQFDSADPDQQYNIDTNGQSVTFASGFGNSTSELTKLGSGTLTLTGSNDFNSGTSINAGILDLGSSGAIGSTGTISFGGGTLQYSGSNQTDYSSRFSSAINQDFNIDTNSQNVTFASNIASTGGELTKLGLGTLTIDGDNTYTGGTTISAGALTVDNDHALGTGAVTNSSILNLGTTNLTFGGAYTQTGTSTLNVTLNSAQNYGSITSTGSDAVINVSNVVNASVGGYISNNTVFDLINTSTGVTATGGTPPINSSDQYVVFHSSVSGNDLILTSDRSTSGFETLGNNANSTRVGKALDNITNPSTDMLNILNTFEFSMTHAQITAALNTMGPIVDGGVIENSTSAINNFIDANLARVQDISSHETIVSDDLDKTESMLEHTKSSNADSGVASGDDEALLQDIWAKEYGGYLSQGTRDGIQGYNARNAGTVIGIDNLLSPDFTVGVSFGYAYGLVDGEVNDASTSMNSAQGTAYMGYQGNDVPFYADALGFFGENWYDGRRDIIVGPFDRVARANYSGDQYGAYFGSGYKLGLGNLLYIAPIDSVQWIHTSIRSYSENGAGALDLNVDNQDYDTLETGLGLSISTPEKLGWFRIVPEFHVKWLHDFINDQTQINAAFPGEAGKFAVNGAPTSKNGADIGGRLSFDLRNDLSLIGQFDTEIKDGFYEIYGSGTLEYKF